MKYLTIIFLIIFQSCSFNYDSNDRSEYDKKKLVKQKNISKIIEKSNDINSMILVKYKIYIDDYIKKSKYPNISK